MNIKFYTPSTIKSIIFTKLPLLLLGLNYVLYNAVGIQEYKLALRIAAILLMITGWLLRGNFTITYVQAIAVGTCVILLLLHGSSALNYIVGIVCVICFKEDIERIIGDAFKVNMFLILIMGIFLLMHVVNNVGYMSTMGRFRWTLGFENPNVAALFYSSAIFLYILSRSRIKVGNILIAFLLAAVIFYFTDSRTSLVALLVYCVVTLAFYFSRDNLRWSRRIGRLCLAVVDALFLLNLISVFFIDKLMVIDELLSYRITSFARMIRDAGWGGFLVGGTSVTVDSFYYMLLFNYGIFIYMFFACITHFTMRGLLRQNNIKYLAFLLAVFLVGLMESSLIRPEILFSLVVWNILFSYNPLYVPDDSKETLPEADLISEGGGSISSFIRRENR